MHGYDIVDHNSLNPEIGSPEEFEHFVAVLHEHKMGLLLDIVPNHMGVMGSDNIWWLDVLENGQSSIHASFFDIDWHPLKDELRGKILIPILHDHYGAVLESGDLKLGFRPNSGEFAIGYKEHLFPIDPKIYPEILERSAHDSDRTSDNADALEFQSLITAFRNLPGRQEIAPARIAERNRDKEIHKRRLATLCAHSPEIARRIASAVTEINGHPGDPPSFEHLHELIKAQVFRLANWKVAADDINYRRFFDTNDLAGIRVENPTVFQETHRLIFQLMSEGKVDGLRLDHPDGLYDPTEYFERLDRGIAEATKEEEAPAEHTKKDAKYVVIEKILSGAERLPDGWPVAGTTGYDFANQVNGLFVETRSVGRFNRIYRTFIDDDTSYTDQGYLCRQLVMRVALASELNVLANRLTSIALSKRRTCDFTLNNLRDALSEVVACFPVYRTYVGGNGLSDDDERYIRSAIASAKWRSPAVDTSVFDFVNDVLLTRIADGQDDAYKSAVISFAMKFQQFTSPVMAKGLEDTAFYRYNRLISLNDVGADLNRFGIPTNEFHSANIERLRRWPHTMLSTSTHDSKRSEDVRARINVLSEIPALWKLHVRGWQRGNRDSKTSVNGTRCPSSNDEYLLYQTLMGAYPSAGLKDEQDQIAFHERIKNYMLKAIREAKQNTSWINRNAEYEGAVSTFVEALLTPSDTNAFLQDFISFQRRIARVGLWNGLSQTFLKLTSPGVPDIYQGTETWNFSLVDPDNRRQVQYSQIEKSLDNVIAGEAGSKAKFLDELMDNPEDGRVKLFLIWKVLQFRHRHIELFERGQYIPLRVEGSQAHRVVAFARKLGNITCVFVVPRLLAGLLQERDLPPLGEGVWGDTSVVLAGCGPSNRCSNELTGHTWESRDHARLPVAQAFSQLPFAVCSLS